MSDLDSYLLVNNQKLTKTKVRLIVEYNGVTYEKSIEGTNDSLKPFVSKLNSKFKKQDNLKKFQAPVNHSKSTSNLVTAPPLVILPPTGSNSSGNLATEFNKPNTPLPSPKPLPHNQNNIKPPPSQHNNNNSNNSNNHHHHHNNHHHHVEKTTTPIVDTTLYGISIDVLMSRQENMKSKVPLISGSQIEVQSRKQAINRGEIDFPKEENPHVISVLFKQFLRELPEPLCTNELYDCFLASSDQINAEETKENGFEVLKKTINMLPPINRILFQYIIHFLTFVSANQSINLMTSQNLGRVFGPNLFWKKEISTVDIHSLQATSEKINSVTEVLINHYDRIFDEPLKVGKKFNLISKLLSHKKSVQMMVCCDKEQKVWSLDSIGSVKVWDSQNRKLIEELSVFGSEDEQNTGAVYQMTVSSNDCIWTATSLSTSIWDSSNCKLIARVPGEAYSLCESQFKQMWVGGAQVINIYDIDDLPKNASAQTPDVRASTDFSRPISTDIFMKGVYILAMAKVGASKIWGCSSDKTLYIWDTKTKDLVNQQEIQEKRPKRITCIEEEGGLETVWIGGDEGTIQIFNANTFKPIHKITNQGWDKIFNLATLNKEIWASFWDTQIRIFDPKTKEIQCSLKGCHSDAISSIIEVPNHKGGDSYIWLGSFDKSISIYNLHNNKWILTNVKKNMARPIRQGFSSRGTNS
ncbi:RhoGAP domain-containing protein [Tieghemostelium lacteum]|uniref:RhoGAP domain-containing protein n=1 Tax=Tieghemostelium lacteum TaxID=361077 RepID=A0A151Z559_TIELA|nr:RhoGAP domain-containing protein [Tieghemostelium lacteum]|eukprot:KYQ89047.1 RhoGAP domain-containing protein [Tieghemostelium lacteum]